MQWHIQKMMTFVVQADGGEKLKIYVAVDVVKKKKRKKKPERKLKIFFWELDFQRMMNNMRPIDAEAQRILEEEFGDDPEVAAYGMKRRIEQIRGKDWENEDS